jgi:hypothetical protein
LYVVGTRVGFDDIAIAVFGCPKRQRVDRSKARDLPLTKSKAQAMQIVAKCWEAIAKLVVELNTRPLIGHETYFCPGQTRRPTLLKVTLRSSKQNSTHPKV